MFSKKNLILMFTLLAVLFTSVCIPGVSAGTSAEVSPVMSVDYISLSFRDSVYIKYAVYTDGADAKLLIWNGEQSEYTEGTHTAEVVSETTQKIGNKTYAIFDYTGVTAKQMADVFYARAYVQEGDKEYYSPVCKYSVLNYAYSILGKTGTASTDENLKTLMSSMLAYGASAQTYLNYKTDRLATMDFYQVKVVGGTLTDTTDRGFYRPDDQVTMIAPAVDASGVPFAGWKNSNGEIVSTDLTYIAKVESKNEIYTATYSDIEEPGEDSGEDSGEELAKYSVVFVDYDGKTISTQSVNAGETATLPDNPSKAGATFVDWSGNYSNVTENETVIAVYSDTRNVFIVESVAGSIGNTVTVLVSVDGNVKTCGFDFDLFYDSSLELISYDNDLDLDIIVNDTMYSNGLKLNFSSASDKTKQRDIIELTFKIKDTTKTSLPIIIDMTEVFEVTESGKIENVSYMIVDGVVTVK